MKIPHFAHVYIEWLGARIGWAQVVTCLVAIGISVGKGLGRAASEWGIGSSVGTAKFAGKAPAGLEHRVGTTLEELSA